MLIEKTNELTDLHWDLSQQLQREMTDAQIRRIEKIKARIKELEQQIDRILTHSYDSHWL